MRCRITFAALALVAAWCVSGASAQNPAQEATPGQKELLPRYLTPEERRLPPLPVERDGRVPPTGDVHCSAEYEPCEGLIITWGFSGIQGEMTKLITNHDEETMVWVVVDNASQQSSASSYLSTVGADMDQVEFIVRVTDSVWVRDYGPRFIFEDFQRAIVDHTYNRPRPNDNLLSDYISTLWGEPQYQMPLTHGGGNFHVFSNGDVFMTELILNENSGYTEQQVIDIVEAYHNVNLTICDAFPSSFDATQHIDMWFLPLDDQKVLVGDYSIDHPGHTVVTVTENTVTDLTARGYTVYRTRGWNAGGTHYTYTNAVILNDLALVPSFGGSYASRDTAALAVFQSAMPDYEIHQVDCSGIIGYAGALHCIVMHVPAYAQPNPIVTVLEPNGGELWVIGQQYDIRWEAEDDVGVTSIDILLSIDGGSTFPYVIATGEANDGVYPWTVPGFFSDLCRVKVIAYDAELNTGEDVSDGDFEIAAVGPQVIYSFPLDADPNWACEGLWEWGQPMGGGGSQGGPDPSSGYTGDNVYGYNLLGDYERTMPQYNLTSVALDLSGISEARLSFYRWLGVETPPYDHAYIRISSDGAAWDTVWHNDQTIADTIWTPVEYDISAFADDEPTVYLRWTMGTSDGSFQYCGWNIDDIEVIGVPAAPPICRGDTNCDGQISFGDINPFVDALINGIYCDGTGANTDMTEDVPVHVGFEDINPFVELLTMNTLPIVCP